MDVEGDVSDDAGEASSLRLAKTPGQVPEITEEYLEALKSLGYVQ